MEYDYDFDCYRKGDGDDVAAGDEWVVNSVGFSWGFVGNYWVFDVRPGRFEDGWVLRFAGGFVGSAF